MFRLLPNQTMSAVSSLEAPSLSSCGRASHHRQCTILWGPLTCMVSWTANCWQRQIDHRACGLRLRLLEDWIRYERFLKIRHECFLEIQYNFKLEIRTEISN